MFNTDHLHPLIVHFPIALIILGFFADVASLFIKNEKCISKTGFYLMVIGALAALAAWSTGELFTSQPVEGEIAKVFVKHEIGGTITMIIMLIGAILRVSLVVRKKEETKVRWVVFGLYFIGFVAVIFTGLMGGIMVYNFMIGQ
jgi:uncharacterized membrane protein